MLPALATVNCDGLTVGNVYTGSALIEKGITFYKLTFENELHGGIQYTNGFIKLHPTEQFNPVTGCAQGGLYILSARQLINHPRMKRMHDQSYFYIRKVTFRPDSLIFADIHKYKCNELIALERSIFEPGELGQYFDRSLLNDIPELQKLILLYPEWLNYIDVPLGIYTEDFCKSLIEITCSLSFVPEEFHTEQLYKIAIMYDPYAVLEISPSKITFALCELATSLHRNTGFCAAVKDLFTKSITK